MPKLIWHCLGCYRTLLRRIFFVKNSKIAVLSESVEFLEVVWQKTVHSLIGAVYCFQVDAVMELRIMSVVFLGKLFSIVSLINARQSNSFGA